MKLALVVTKLDQDDNPIEHAREEHKFPECRVVAGSVANADLNLEGLAELSFMIDRDEEGSLVFVRKEKGLDVIINNEHLKEDRRLIHNGDVLRVNHHDIFVSVEFDRAEPNTRSNLLPLITAVLVSLILVTELCIATWLPRTIHRSRIAGAEVLRQNTLHQLDVTRAKVSTKQAFENRFVRPTLKLYKAEVDRMAMHMRANQTRMSLEQYETFKRDIERIQRQVDLLLSERLVPPAKRLDLEKSVEEATKQKEATK